MSGQIDPIVMPKWGLAMEEGMLVEWQIEEGTQIEKGQEIADIETTKITNIFESPTSGQIRRIVTSDGETVPVGFLLAVCAGDDVSDADIDSYVEDFKANFVLEETAAGGAAPESVEIAPGQSIRYLTMGNGDTPIVFVHGFGGGFDNWMLNQEALSEDHKTYAIDLPGHGGSTKQVGEGDLAAMTGTLHDFMSIMKIERAHLVGHSMGGGIALNFAFDHPGQVASLSLIAPVGFGTEINMDYIDGFISQTRAKKLRAVLELLVNDPAAISTDMVEDIIKYKRLDGVGVALGQLRDKIMPEGRQASQLKDRLDDLVAPVQVIWGRNDQIIPSSHAEGLSGRINVQVYDDTGHMPHLERASEVNTLIGDLAASV
ncbi:acetoin dehydrogenase dihydrolipoyllysine-residue acetyltransferase subunit [Pelagibius sp. Alg239-R121]|uniref:acetoin dehydrogenase dihydrolipoyllysine-residue acetyltransferase subunit n=1 Tax=Pelagibius sp. Alg239-R121 TaxID=2993448 RepID=UPI0024A700D9|nr:acetoin dehydrogenase dihydrolipoyllysine-residue acetyltransferase subunit [Pelagibius sp. Alg239-R121]